MAGCFSEGRSMEDLRVWRHFLVLLGTVALICLMIGYFSHGWLEYSLRIEEEEEVVDVKVSRGLWSTSGCVVLNFSDFTHDACGEIAEHKMDTFIERSDLEEDAKVATKALFDMFTKLRILLMFGGIHGVVGLIFSLFIHKGGRNIFVLSRGYCCVYSWAASAVLVMTAIGLQASQATSFNGVIDSLEVTSDVAKERIRLNATMSWVMHVSGYGSLAGLFMAIALFIKLCCLGASHPKPVMTRSETEQTMIHDHISEEDEDEEDEVFEGRRNFGFNNNEAGGRREERDKSHGAENGEVNVKCLMDIYM